MVRLKARHWGGVALTAVVLGVAGWLVGHQRVGVPLLLERVPLRALLPGIAAIVVTYPLLDWYPGFSDTFVRESRLRRRRVLATAALYAIAVVPGTVAAVPGGTPPGDLVLASAFLTLSLAAVVVVGDLSWLVVLTVTFAYLFLNAPPIEPLTRAATTLVAVVVVLAVFTLASGAYVRRGPGRRRLAL